MTARPLRQVQRVHAFTGRTIAVARPRRGDTVRSFVVRERLAVGLPTIVTLRTPGGEARPLMRAEWDRPIRTRDTLILLSAPRGGGRAGGGSQSVASIVGLVALLAIAGPLGGAAALGGLFGGGAIATSIASALIIGGGSLLISHFLGAGRPKPDAPEYSIDISSNQARSQQPVPCQYGRVKFFPDLASPIYTDYAGITQVFHGLYSLGVGTFILEEIGIGTQPIWRASGGALPGFPSLRTEYVAPGANCALFPINVYTAPEVSGQTLPDPYGTTYPDGSTSTGPNGEHGGPHPLGPFIAVPPGEVATDFAVDFIWPSGLYKSTSSGSQTSAECRIRLWVQSIDDQGHVTGNRYVAFDKTYTYNSKIPVRVTEKFSVPTAGRIQVDVGRLDKQGRSGYTDGVSWAGLKAYVQGPNAVPYASRLAIQLQADNLLSSYSSQQIYVIATREVPVYNPSTGQFVKQATRNPIWAALDVWHNADYGGGLPLDHVDLPTFATLAAGADARGDAFNYRFTAQTTLLEAIDTCLRPMLTTAVYLWDRLSAVRDEPRSFPALMLTDFEILRGSLEIVYTLKDTQTSDGVILQYIDEDTWKSAEVTSRVPGVTLQQPTRITQSGNTNRRQATDVARYHAAVNNYRRKTLTCQIEGEGRIVRRGKLVTVQSELPQSWGQALRVDSVGGGGTITTSAPADWSASGTHYVRIRRQDGLPFGPVACVRGAGDSQIVLDLSDRQRVEAQQGLNWMDAVARGPLQEPASIELGVGMPMAFQGLVNSVTRGDQENTFKLELVVDAPEVHGRSGAVDPLPTPSPLVLPTGPALLTGISARLEQTDAVIMLYASWNPDPVSVTYTAQVSFDAGATWPYVAYAEGELCSFQYGPMPSGNNCHLRIRGRSANNITGPWAEVTLTSPNLDLSFLVPNQSVGYYDLPTETFDQAILTDELELAAVVETVNLRHLMTVAEVQANFADYTQTTTVIALTATVDTNNKTVTASIVSEAGIRLTQNQAVATLITVLQASFDTTTASTQATIQQEAQTRASGDGALALTISDLSASLNGNIAAEVLTRQTAVADANNAIATLSTQLTSSYNSLSASLGSEQGTRASADSAFAGQLSTIQASADGASASGAISWQVVAGQSGYADAQYNLRLKAGVGNAKTQTGLFLEATDTDSRIVLTASKFQIQDAGTRTVPFAISGGDVYLQGVTKVSSTIQSQATTQSGHPVLSIDFVNGALEIWDNS